MGERPTTIYIIPLPLLAPTCSLDVSTSPHHFKRMDAGDYVRTLVKLDGSVDEWMTTMTCCDSYQQRESVDVAMTDGDRRMVLF